MSGTPNPDAAIDAEAATEADCSLMANPEDFLLDAESWEKWVEIVNRPARDLPGLRAFLTTPIHAVAE